MPLGTEVGLGPEDIVLDGDPSPLPQKAAEPSPQFSAHFCCGQTAGWIKVVFGMELGLLPGHIVLDGDPAPFPLKWAEPASIFGPFLLWPNGWMHQDATWYGGRLQPRDFALDEDTAPPQKGGGSLQFSAHVYCGQTAAWIKMPVGTEVGLGLRNIVFDVDPATPEKRAHPLHPILAHVYCGQMAGWMKTPLGTEVDLGPGHMYTRRGPSSGESGTAAPSFRPMFIVATVAHLSYC